MIIDQLFTRPIFESQMDPITQFASNAHEEWRRNFDPTGTKPRIKKNSDGTEGDINVPFADLHPDWQKENLAAGHAAHRAVKHFGRNMEKAAEHVHNEWMKRNPKADYNAAQHVPYDDLSDDEKEKDRVHVRTMMRLMGHHPEQGVAEVAPPGARAERMVRHIKQGYARDGKLTPKEKGIAFATAWKAHNAGRVEEDLSRRGFLKGAGAAATMAAAGPEITTLVNGFAEKAGGLNGIQALKAMLKIATPDELYNMYDYYADSGILEDAITDSDMIALDRAGYDNWSDFEEHCDENSVDPDDEFKRLTGQPLKVSLVDDILGQVDDTWSLEDFFEEYPDALKIINPFENGSISMPTLRQLANIDTATKGAHLPAPIVTMANAVAGLVRQIFKSNGQSLAAPQQTTAQSARHTPALPAPTRPEFDMTPDLKQKQKVPVQRKGDDEEPEDPSLAPEDPRKLLQRLRDAGAYSRGALQDIIDGTDKSGMMTKEKAQELLNKHYGPQKPSSSQTGNQGVAEDSENYNGLQFSIVKDSRYLRVNAFAPGPGRAIAQVDFKIDNKNELHPEDLHVEERYRGQGIAATMYDFVKSKGYNIHRSWSQTDDGAAFWNKHRGEKRVWEQGVTEGLTEMDKSEPSAGRDTGPRPGPDREAKPITAKKATKDMGDMLTRAVRDSHKKKDVKEGEIEQTKTGIRHRGHRYGSGEELPNGGGNRSGFPNPGKYARDLDHLDKNLTSKLDHSMDVSWPHGNKKRDMDEGIVDKAAGVSLKMATPELLKMAGFIKAYIKAEAPDALPAMEEILQRLRFYSTQETGNYNIGALQNLHRLAMSIKSHLRPDSEVAPFLTEFIRIVKWYLDETIKLVNENNDPLMLKLRRALIKEGRVKELALDLKTMSDADFMKKYGKAKAAIRKDMSRIDEKLTTSDPFAFPAAKASSGRAIDDPDIMGSLKGASEPKFDRFSKTSNEPKLDFRAGITGDDETEVEAEPRLAADPNPYMQSWGGKYATGGSREPQWRYVEKGEDPARYGSNTTVSGTGTPDWRSIAASSKSAAAPIALDPGSKNKYKFDRTTQSQVSADGSGANPNIDDATRDRARAWAAQQNAPSAALAGAMRSSGTPVDTAKNKTDWKSIYDLNKAVIGSNPNIIKPGMKLKMPNGSTYSVQPGDTLSKIASNQINELSTNRLAQYKTAAAKDAKQADQEGDFKRGDKRFHGIVQATKKQFDNDAKKVDESRAARRALMARIVNHR